MHCLLCQSVSIICALTMTACALNNSANDLDTPLEPNSSASTADVNEEQDISEAIWRSNQQTKIIRQSLEGGVLTRDVWADHKDDMTENEKINIVKRIESVANGDTMQVLRIILQHKRNGIDIEPYSGTRILFAKVANRNYDLMRSHGFNQFWVVPIGSILRSPLTIPKLFGDDSDSRWEAWLEEYDLMFLFDVERAGIKRHVHFDEATQDQITSRKLINVSYYVIRRVSGDLHWAAGSFQKINSKTFNFDTEKPDWRPIDEFERADEEFDLWGDLVDDFARDDRSWNKLPWRRLNEELNQNQNAYFNADAWKDACEHQERCECLRVGNDGGVLGANAEIIDSIVEVLDADSRQTIGTGFYIGRDLILSNYHVVGDDLIRLRDIHGSEFWGVVQSYDGRRDLALVQVTVEGEPLSIFREEQLRYGDQVIALGHPAGRSFIYTQGVVSKPVMDSRSWVGPGELPRTRVVLTDAAVNEGNSGGPLVRDAEVIGVNSVIAIEGDTFLRRDLEGLNYAIHYDELLSFLVKVADVCDTAH